MKSFDIFLEALDPKGMHVGRFIDRRINYAMHYHPQFELMYCNDGEMKIHLDKYTYPLTAGTFAVIAPLAVHSVSCEDKCSCTYIHIPDAVYLQVSGAAALSAPYTGFIFTAGENDTFDEFWQMAETVYDTTISGDKQIAAYYAMILLTLCIRHIQNADQQVVSVKSSSHPMLRDVLSYAQRHYKEPITLAMLCKEFNIGKSAMSEMINTQLQTSLPELLNKYRMLEAERLLLQTQMPITEISGEVGYGSVCNFNRNFQKHFGTSPREYRKQK
ncbi:MAG: helix-turn-helix domain-containing protein [Oscillospiraceae bacterium]|nr:helix-turn-helix domain-containing protein [Oscillospiraceae bacterium]